MEEGVPAFRNPIAAHRGLLVLRCQACGHAWVAEWTPLRRGCPECRGSPQVQFRAGFSVIRRFPRKVATDLAALLRNRKVDEAWAMVRSREAGGERFVEGRGR